MTDTELKPCPFCGPDGHVEIHGDMRRNSYPTVKCEMCGANARLVVWNTRAETDADKDFSQHRCGMADKEKLGVNFIRANATGGARKAAMGALETLEKAAKTVADSVQMEQSGFDQPPEPASERDYEMDQCAGAMYEAIRTIRAALTTPDHAEKLKAKGDINAKQ